MRNWTLRERGRAFWFRRFAVSILIVASSLVVAESPPPTPTATALQAAPSFVPYSHFAQGEPLVDVLADFARAQGLQPVISEALSGVLSGRFDQAPPLAFLAGLERAFGVRWYVLGQNLHFYHASESVREFIPAKSLSADELYDLLADSGLVSPQLPLKKPAAANGLLSVAGSSVYVARIKAMAAELERSVDARMTLRVFKLKYASADDLVIDSMGRSLTVPGVASILRAMVGGQSAVGTVSEASRSTVGKLKGTGLARKAASAPTESPPSAGQLSSAGTGAAGSGFNIVADARVNAVVVQDTAGRMPYYEQVIADLDRETHLVEINASIVDVDTNHRRDLGLDWQARHGEGEGFSVGGQVASGAGDASLLPSPDQWGKTAGGAISTIYTRGANFFMARIAAMQKRGAAQMLGQPSVLTSDNLEATLENTTTYYIEVAGNEEVDLFKVESGTVLRVTPHIIEQEQGTPSIRLQVTVQDDQENPDSNGSMSGKMAIPPIKQTRINTQAIIDAGQSLLIGGYYYERKTDTETGVPVLMDIPLLGQLFKSTGKESQQMERLILITPRIVRLGEQRALPPTLTEAGFSRNAQGEEIRSGGEDASAKKNAAEEKRPAKPALPPPLVDAASPPAGQSLSAGPGLRP